MKFRTDHLLLMDTDVRPLGWLDLERTHAFCQRALERLRRVPGVVSAAVSDRAPLAGLRVNFRLVDPVEAERVQNGFVTPDFFNIMGSHFEQGRTFTDGELERHEFAAVINREMAEYLWPQDPSPLGRTFVPWERDVCTVVGVLDRAPPPDLESAVGPQFYLPSTTVTFPTPTFLVRVEDDSPLMRQRLTDQLAEFWPLPELPRWRSMQDQIALSQGDLSTSVRVLLGAALLSSVVTALGLYFFSAFTATLTLRDSALRLALGATWQALVRRQLCLFAGTGAIGLGVGSLLVFGARPILARLNVATTPPNALHLTLAAVPLLLILVLGLSLPLWRLRRLDVCRTLSLD